jgi:FG-GAP-like repeat
MRLLPLAGLAVVLAGTAVAAQARSTWFAGAAFPVGLAVTDENGDGAPDVVSANARRSVSVLLGRGDGRLLRGVAFRADGEHEAAAVADVNRDGFADAVLFNQLGAVSVLPADGHGHFGAPVRYAAGRRPWTGALGDLNGDGAPDIVAVDWGKDSISSSDDRLVVLLNKGDGTFGGPAFTTAPPTDLPWALATADLNHDSHVDVVETTTDSFVNVLLGNGDGTFAPVRTSPTGSRSTALALSDLNGDGKLDLAVGEDGGTIDVKLGAGDGTFGPAQPLDQGLLEPNEIVAADFDNDGHVDLAASPFDAKAGGILAVMFGRGDGTFVLPAQALFSGGGPGAAQTLAAGDLDSDGRPDLVAEVNTTVAVLKSLPGRKFSESVRYPTGPAYCRVAWVINHTVAQADRAIRAGGCRVGRIHQVYSRKYMRGRVVRQKPRGLVEPEPPRGTAVTLWVSRGPRKG